jgi:hypothetical protein
VRSRHDLVFDSRTREQEIDYHVRALVAQPNAGEPFYIVLLKDLDGRVASRTQIVYKLLCFGIAGYGYRNVQIPGEAGNRPGGDSQAADECPPRSGRIQSETAWRSAVSTDATISFPGRQAELVIWGDRSQPGLHELVNFGLARVRVLAAHALPVQPDSQLVQIQRSPQAFGRCRRALSTSGHLAPRPGPSSLCSGL